MAQPKKKPDTVRRRRKWTLEAEVRLLREEVLSLRNRVSELEAAGRDPEQAYFWSEKWQEGEREVNEEVERGEIQSFDNFEDFEAWLDEP